MNTPIQGLAADIMKYVTGRVEQLLQQQQQRALRMQDLVHIGAAAAAEGEPCWRQDLLLRRPLRAQVVLQIHDELLLEVYEDDVPLVFELVLPLMQRAWGLLLVETDCLDRYAALFQLQQRLQQRLQQQRLGDPHYCSSAAEETVLRCSALEAAGFTSTEQQLQHWFKLPPQYEWLRPLLQRRLPTNAKVGRDWGSC